MRSRFASWDWRRTADVLLVVALVGTLGVTAKTVLDQRTAVTQGETTETLGSGRQDGGVADSLTAAAPESVATHRVTASGTLVVQHRLVPAAATSDLTLSNGSASRANGGGTGAIVRDLRVIADGSPVEPTQTTVEEGEVAEVLLDDAASEFLFSYVVEDAVATATSGRAVVELRTLRTDELTGPQILRVRSGETGDVLSLACGRSLAVAEPCGRDGLDGWSVRLPDTEPGATVFASVDLPTG